VLQYCIAVGEAAMFLINISKNLPCGNKRFCYRVDAEADESTAVVDMVRKGLIVGSLSLCPSILVLVFDINLLLVLFVQSILIS
jgi:hypothetical protein